MSKKLRITTYTSSDLAKIYNISTKTVRRWVRPLEPETGPRIGNYYYPKQVRIIVENLNKRFTPDAEVAEKILEIRMKRLFGNAPKRKR